MAAPTTESIRRAPPRLLAALRRAGASQELLRDHYGIAPDEPIPSGPPELLSVEDMEFLPEDGYRYELWEGELVRMSPSKLLHGDVAGEIVRHLNVYLTQHPLGKVYIAEVGFRAGPNQSLYCPDAAYLSHERIAAAPLDEFVPFAPDIAIEVWSPDNTRRKLEIKARNYLRRGAQLVWILRPQDKTARVHRPDAPAQTLPSHAILSGDDVLPGFAVRVGDLFPV